MKGIHIFTRQPEQEMETVGKELGRRRIQLILRLTDEKNKSMYRTIIYGRALLIFMASVMLLLCPLRVSLAFQAKGLPNGAGSIKYGNSHPSGSPQKVSSSSNANSIPPLPSATPDAPSPSVAQLKTQETVRVQPMAEQQSDVLGNSTSMLALAMQAMNLLIALITILVALITIAVAVAAAIGLFEARRWKALRREAEEYAVGVRAVRDNARAARDRLTAEFGSLNVKVTYTPSDEVRDLADELGQALTLLELVGVPLSSRDYLNRATDLFYKGRIQRCLRAIDKSIELDKSSSLAWNSKCFTLMHLKEYKGALAAADEALKLDERAANAWDNRGACLLKLGYLDEALEAIENAKRLSPLADEIWYNLACLHAIKGHPEEVLRHLSEAIKLEPRNKVLAQSEPDFDVLAKNPRFRQLVQQESEVDGG